MDIEVRQRQKDMHSGDNALQAFKRSHAKSKALENKKGAFSEKGSRKERVEKFTNRIDKYRKTGGKGFLTDFK